MMRVHVLVDLLWSPTAGGHVKVWERLAHAALELPEVLDLTVHFSGTPSRTHRLGGNVRFQLHPPVFSSARLPFLAPVPAHTDLARHHPGLAGHLRDGDVLHTTDAYFAFARTAERIASTEKVALVSSVHTDTPLYTALFSAATLERLLGRGLGRLLSDGCQLSRRAQDWMERRLLAHQRRCAYALVSRPAELERVARQLSPERVGLLRRGIDHQLFSPRHADRRWLETHFSLPSDRVVLAYVGRLDRAKNVLTLVEAIRTLVAERWPLHLLCVGDGPDRSTILERLPRAATCPGMLDPQTLARIYASADLFAQPSVTEECSNVILEALASGLPVATSARSAGWAVVPGENGVVTPGDSAADWVHVLRGLAQDRAQRERMASAARARAERAIPSWREVLAQDLLPFWTKAARATATARSRADAVRTDEKG